MSKQIKVYIGEIEETLEALQDTKPQTFELKRTSAEHSIKLSVENTFGGRNAGGNFTIIGVKCENPMAKKLALEKAKLAAMGVKAILKAQAKNCTDTMDSMTSDKAKITCLEDCQIQESAITEIEDGYFTMDSAVCIAAKKY